MTRRRRVGPCRGTILARAEEPARRLQLLRLRRQLLRGRRHLFRRRRVLLRHLVELLDRLVDLLRADVLFTARSASAADPGDHRWAAGDVDIATQRLDRPPHHIHTNTTA